MKPIVIYVDKQKNNITLTREEFEDFINKAYEQGYSCGYADGKKNSFQWPYNGGFVYTNATNTTGTPPKINPYEITCTNDTINKMLEINNEKA